MRTFIWVGVAAWCVAVIYALALCRAAAMADHAIANVMHGDATPPIHPEICVRIDRKGDTCSILCAVTGAMHRGGCTIQEISEFVAEATEGDCAHALRTAMRFVAVA